jgi:hypothetical protein
MPVMCAVAHKVCPCGTSRTACLPRMHMHERVAEEQRTTESCDAKCVPTPFNSQEVLTSDRTLAM